MRSQVFRPHLWGIHLGIFAVIIFYGGLSQAAEIEASYSLVGAVLTAPVKGGDGFRQLGNTTSAGSNLNVGVTWGEKSGIKVSALTFIQQRDYYQPDLTSKTIWQ